MKFDFAILTYEVKTGIRERLMKKMGKKAKWAFNVLVIVAMLIFVYAFSRMMRPAGIEQERVEKVMIRSFLGSTELGKEDAERFVEFFNQTEYKGDGAGEGEEPEIQAFVVMNDGSTLIVNSFNGKERILRCSSGIQAENKKIGII